MNEARKNTVLEINSRFGLSLKASLNLAYQGVRFKSADVLAFGSGVSPEDVNYVAQEIYNGTTVLERIPQRVRQGLAAGSLALCAAEALCNGCPQTESESRPLYDTDDLKGEGLIQEQLVEEWARRNGRWIEEPENYLASISELTDAGTESVVYFSPSEGVVYKTMTLKYYNVLRPALDRIVIHNALFPDTAMTVLGFGRLENCSFTTVIRQPYVVGTKPSEEQRAAHMHSLGFKDAGMDYGMHLNYVCDDLYVGDVNEYNAILTPEGVSVIDADCRILRPGLL